MRTIKKIAALLLFLSFLLNSNAQCKADFTFNIIGSDTIQVVNSSSPTGGLTYKWIAPGLSFINGTTDSSVKPVLKVNVKGEYKIRLIILNKSTNCTDTHTVDIKIKLSNWCVNALADFDYSISNNLLYLTQKCSPSQTAANGGLRWSVYTSEFVKYYPDFRINSRFNPITFSAPEDGLYGIYLFYVHKASACKDSILKVVELKKNNLPCRASFNVDDTYSYHLFYDSSFVSHPNAAISYWDFGDGNSRSNPFMAYSGSHTYSNTGTFNVRLIVEDTIAKCRDTAYKQVIVKKLCRTGFRPVLMSKLRYRFDGSLAKNPPHTFYTWTFGDGNTAVGNYPIHTYSSAGNYTVCIMIEDTLIKCRDTICKTVSIGAPAPASCIATWRTYQGNVIGNLTFSPSNHIVTNPNLNYLWTFEDGSTSTQRFPNRIYTSSGNYNICLRIINTQTGCRDSVCDSIYVRLPDNGCNANFSFNSNKLQTTFSNSSPGSSIGIEYLWLFGDGDTSTQTNPTHLYSAGGAYNVCLIRFDTATKCVDTTCKLVTVLGPPNCSASFVDSNITNSLINFKNTSTVTSTNPRYLWNFGDTANLFYSSTNPQHSFASSGTFNVCLFLTDSTAGGVCKDTVCKNITIQPPKCKASFTDSSITNTYVQFKNTSHTNGSNPNYIWDFGDVFNVNSFVKNPLYLYLNTGVFNVCLYIEDSTFAGVCRDTLCQSININYNQLGVAESSTGKSFSIYPNPSNGVFNLDWETEGENNSIIVYNSSGVMIKNLDEMDPNSYEKTIDLSDFPDGMYFIQLHGNNSVESVRVIKSN